MNDNKSISQEITTHNEEKTIYNKMFLVNGLPEGEAITYKESGELIQKMNYNAGKLEGDLLYYENGKVKSKIPFKNNLQDGEAIYYDSDGNEIGKENYKEGKREGKSEWKDKSGNKLFTSNYKSGQLNGERLLYHPNGKIKKREMYDSKGILTSIATFNSLGINLGGLKALINMFK